MAISKEEVVHVATLSRLKLTEEETEQYTKQLNDILQFAEKLNQLDTEQIEPTSHVLPIENVLRDDEVRPSIPREKALLNAPDQKNGMFRVPAVFEE
ncbi:Asp-tRNA(Asn)/Glu-tRNA(Gln) amidotransferase subunit GatC [Thermoflavimicrobium daqui]|uniref:Aspartyl/glutamyl-tRNA(Asn/Gln) amidotransferase subunit C n=1 Tax=Thermoflavimicrobium daqui TaxID=2137476 RepID=A0A364K4Q7_9BACL|nr:Asp-tRNA(Asn)/Glu-tRNA(Gln) amidotransferase subunit GatC [Thermoflavimicrobium daqui]RAL24364.1 Asp-tRNA(Asn)/Glu-tRNA(Gln) amidotransferase GatCAB subunit C [Thermoflavimicrobium daqui]